ncbi:LysR family transcriptional regulator [Roseateles violae]|uniref:LysR family transcriptional regulator n=1 Tax=Roseateles violae TaxID=3058042 RepID=A0ABT8DNV9_9BURK|nr:LysR family transcriptional regulator [Pelomonas sp. PFR6]MDN3920052.1 LysR family transcriptional regulator [Pelomonas sp. PFR6]
MTLVQLRHLISLAQTGSFSQSAAALFLTQPALSRSIRALESELGQPLFDRIGRRSELTPFGRDAVERARELVLAADDLRDSGRLAGEAQRGVLRIGMGSGPGAMLMTPLLLKMAQDRPGLRVEIARASTELLLRSLRERTLDALVVDARSLRPAADLNAQFVHEMRAAFMVRRAHPLARRRGGVGFDELLHYPIASTPLSDEVARILIERYGPRAHPDECVTLRCEEIPSLVDVARRSDAVLLAVSAAAPDLVELSMQPPLAATARFGLVTLRRRTAPPGLAIVQTLMAQLLVDPK